MRKLKATLLLVAEHELTRHGLSVQLGVQSKLLLVWHVFTRGRRMHQPITHTLLRVSGRVKSIRCTTIRHRRLRKRLFKTFGVHF